MVVGLAMNLKCTFYDFFYRYFFSRFLSTVRKCVFSINLIDMTFKFKIKN